MGRSIRVEPNLVRSVSYAHPPTHPKVSKQTRSIQNLTFGETISFLRILVVLMGSLRSDLLLVHQTKQDRKATSTASDPRGVAGCFRQRQVQSDKTKRIERSKEFTEILQKRIFNSVSSSSSSLLLFNCYTFWIITWQRLVVLWSIRKILEKIIYNRWTLPTVEYLIVRGSLITEDLCESITHNSAH